LISKEYRNKINDINAYLLILFAFILPLSVALTNVIAGIIILLWILRGTFKEDFIELKTNKVVLAVIAFYVLHILGLFWTDDFQWGIHILKKETKFLLLPIMMLFVRYEHIKYYIYAFLLAMSITEVLSYGVWLEIIPEFKNATVLNPTPFMSHISYNPILAFAIYILISNILFNLELNLKQKVIYCIFAVTMSINMFITGGRAGQVMYFAVIFILLFQYFNKQKVKALLLSIIVIPAIFFTAYNSSNLFKSRVDMAIYNTLNYHENKATSMGERLTFWVNSIEIIVKNPLLGVGTGDFKNEYKKINQKNSPNIPNTVNPHNMYILELVQFGLLGLLSLILILYNQVKIALLNKSNFLRKVGVALPFLFAVIMLSDSYLLGHYTSMLFIFFSAFLYKEYDSIYEK